MILFYFILFTLFSGCSVPRSYVMYIHGWDKGGRGAPYILLTKRVGGAMTWPRAGERIDNMLRYESFCSCK